MLHVLLPTTPNPATGFLIFVARKSVIPSTLSVEDGLKLAISGGLVGPGVLPPSGAPSPG
jgi:uncharacterized membrane protein